MNLSYRKLVSIETDGFMYVRFVFRIHVNKIKCIHFFLLIVRKYKSDLYPDIIDIC